MKILLVIGGSLSVTLGVLGLFLPVLPTTPFLLLAAAAFVRSSDRLYNWLITHPWFGQTIRDYQENRSLARRTKVWAITLLWASILASSIWGTDNWIVRMLLLAIALGVTVYLLRLPTQRERLG